LLSDGRFFFESLHRIRAKESRELKYEPSAEEIQAGIEDFSKFGEFSPMYALAGGDITKFDAVVMQPWKTVFRTMQYRIKEAQFRKRLQEIYQNKAQQQ
jgi:hypothetical protein